MKSAMPKVFIRTAALAMALATPWTTAPAGPGGPSPDAAPAVSSACPEGRAPNFVLILVDDLGWRDLGFMGSAYYETPNTDRLASRGVVFTHAYANAPNCAPTRASILSGQYTPRHGVYTVGNPDRGPIRHRKLVPTRNNIVLDPKIVTLAECLKGAGYACGHFGKWHLGDGPLMGPLGQGFDVNIGGGRWGHPPDGYFPPFMMTGLEQAPEGEYLTDRLTDEACRFMEDNRDRPFFLYLPYYAVHTPIQAKEELVGKYEKKEGSRGQDRPEYAAMVETVDRGVGRILDRLDRLKLAEDTVVIFFSDNGGVKGITSMEPLRGGKGMLYEGGIRVPMVVCWPGRFEAGLTRHEPVMGIDFYPTLLDLSGAGRPEGQILDGMSLVPLLRRKDIEEGKGNDGGKGREKGSEKGGVEGGFQERALFWHFPAYLQGEAEGARDPIFRTRPCGAVRKGNWKLIEYFEDSELELYDLAADPGETKNLAPSHPEKTGELHEALKAWRKSVNAPVPVERNPRYDPDGSSDRKKP